MTWRLPERSPTARQIYAEAERDRLENPHRYRFDADRVGERATRGGKHSPRFSPTVGHPHWRSSWVRPTRTAG